MPSYPLHESAENLWAVTCTIPAGANVADAFSTQGHAIVGIVMPAAWTAAVIGIEASVDSGKTWNTAYSNVSLFEQSLAQASSFIAFPFPDKIAAPDVRLKSVDATNVAVNQVAAATIIVILSRLFGGS